MRKISIKGARVNNLKNIDLEIPRNKLVCFVGVSGSGKSTIAFDIIAKEGERQYFESLSSFARRYLTKSNKPDVDSIEGISPTIVISQGRVRNNPRSTVGTLTEAYTYLRLMFARVGRPSIDSYNFSFNHPLGACKHCKGLGRGIEIDLNKLIDPSLSLNEGAIKASEWATGGRMWSIIKATGYFNMDKKLNQFSREELDRLLYSPKELLQDQGGTMVNKWTYQGIVTRMKGRNTSVHRGPSKSDLSYFKFVSCPECNGGRLKDSSLKVRVNGKNIGEVANMSIIHCLQYVKSIDHPYATPTKPRLLHQLQCLIDVGVGYLSLNRSSDTLSGGEAQRVKMARQLGSNLIETIYVLDEPTAGLHIKDVDRLVSTLSELRDHGNSVLVVEHDEKVIRNSDFIVEIGPGGGKYGGKIVGQGSLDELLSNGNSITTRYLQKRYDTRLKEARRANGSVNLPNARNNNLKNINVDIPTGVLISLTGVSGSGKSSFVEELLTQLPGNVVLMDQSQVGNNKRGSIVTYIGAFNIIRKIFADESGLSERLFSFNGKGGCSECKGIGHKEIEMNFLGDIKVKCDVCKGSRYKEEVLKYRYKGKNIAEVLRMTATEVKDFFSHQKISEQMKLLEDVGLDYVEIGQTLDTLSGGESQRLKLATRLQSKGEFYILDEPSSGLHFADIEKLMKLLNRIVDNGNTVLVVEHNLEIIRQSDWIIELGPEGGDKGGYLIAQGTPKEIQSNDKSILGHYLTYPPNTLPTFSSNPLKT